VLKWIGARDARSVLSSSLREKLKSGGSFFLVRISLMLFSKEEARAQSAELRLEEKLARAE
jgi:hypothetical protein